MYRDNRQLQMILTVVAVFLTSFVLYSTIFNPFISTKHRAIVLMLGLVLCFMLFPIKANMKKFSYIDFCLLITAIAAIGYVVLNFNEFIHRAGNPNTADIIMGTLAILLVLEGTRRAVGWVLPFIACIFIFYTLFGNFIPGTFGHPGFSYDRLINQLYISTEGLFGTALGVASTFVFLFIFFGSLLQRTGAGQFFIDLAVSLAGRSKGGPAKIAVISSGIMGTISGSSIANVSSTGAFTIPLMKQIGYKSHFAGGVEASASTGGQIMPPIMGAAAFIMAEIIGVPYSEIILAATLPAILYYFSIYMTIHLEASRIGLSGLPANQIPNLVQTVKKGLLFFVPLIIIITTLLSGTSAIQAAHFGVLTLILVSFIKKSTRLSIKQLLQVFKDAAQTSVMIILACTCAGIIIGTVSLTGVGLKFTDFVVSFSQGYLLLGLILTMLASIILGMSLPTVASYIVLSVLAGPALVELGVPVLAAHLFILYFGVFADITPPVALASYAGAGLAGSPPMKTSITTVKIAFIGFLVPYLFVYFPSLLWIGGSYAIISATITSILGIVSISAVINGYLLKKTIVIERILLLLSGATLIIPGNITDVIGIVSLLVVWTLQYKVVHKSKIKMNNQCKSNF